MQYLSIVEAQKNVIEAVSVQSAEVVNLEQSLGRVLAEDVHANRDLPPYDVSAMDGFAVRSVDMVAAPTILEVVEDIRAGDMPSKSLKEGKCARIMTGAPMPQGADAVIRVEETEALEGEKVQINSVVKPGNDIRLRGENMGQGDVVLASGTEITPGVIGILATVKRAQIEVYRRPSVAILSTGDELEGLDEPIDPNKIPDANSHALMAQVQALGIEPVMLGIARDDPAELREYLQRGLKFDVLLVSGGTSVGVHDYVRPTIESLGVQMKFWRVAMKPGHPMAFGTLGTSMIFGLPGNPVSSMVCFEHFVVPALRKLMGCRRLYRRTILANLTHDVRHRPGRTEFIRVVLDKKVGAYEAASTGSQGSGILLSMAKADGLMEIPADSAGVSAGDQVKVILLDGTVFQEEIDSEE